MPARGLVGGPGREDFDLTETAVQEWVKQSERDAGTRQDGGLTSRERRELCAGAQTAANAGVPEDQAGLAAALITASFQLGSALGLAIFSGPCSSAPSAS